MSDQSGRTPTVQVVGEVEKVESFNTSGGGHVIKIKVPRSEDEGCYTIDRNRQRICDIAFAFRETYAEEDDDQDELFDDEIEEE